MPNGSVSDMKLGLVLLSALGLAMALPRALPKEAVPEEAECCVASRDVAESETCMPCPWIGDRSVDADAFVVRVKRGRLHA